MSRFLILSWTWSWFQRLIVDETNDLLYDLMTYDLCSVTPMTVVEWQRSYSPAVHMYSVLSSYRGQTFSVRIWSPEKFQTVMWSIGTVSWRSHIWSKLTTHVCRYGLQYCSGSSADRPIKKETFEQTNARSFHHTFLLRHPSETGRTMSGKRRPAV